MNRIKDKVHSIFTNSYAGRRQYKTKPVVIVVMVVVGALTAVVMVFGGAAERKRASTAVVAPSAATTKVEKTPEPNTRTPSDYVPIPREGLKTNRTYSASQLVRRNSGTSNGEALPMASTLAAQLLNTVLSTDNVSPVVAILRHGGSFNGTSYIPPDTKAIGTAALDDTSKRLQARFHTLVFPDGEQGSFSALALQPDGSSGLIGTYNSGNVEHSVGQFAGTFVGGLASGLKDRQPGGLSGPFEPGSIKNGLLNGLSDVASEQTRQLTDQKRNSRPYLEVPSGTQFILYLEKEFSR